MTKCKLKRGEFIIAPLPAYVSAVFYRRSDEEMWANDSGVAFGNSIPHSKEDVRKALTWLVKRFGGKVTWSKHA